MLRGMRHGIFRSVVFVCGALNGAVLDAQSTGGQAERITYGAAPTSFGELTVPTGAGPFPIAILLHGGCWRSDRGGAREMRPLASALAARGIAAWNVEYRRVGHDGGGWPGTFRDLADATDHVRALAASHPLDRNRVVMVGHSSGGYFGAWVAGRGRLPKGSSLTGSDPLRLAGLVLLDAFLDPGVMDSTGTDGAPFCGAPPVLPGLVGGDPKTLPDHLHQISPLTLLPYRIPQEYVVSSLRYPVTPPRPLAGGRTTYAVADYPALARAAGDTVNVVQITDADHFDFLKPGTHAWPAVLAAVARLADVASK
jgi:acetyl esterase/lipase